MDSIWAAIIGAVASAFVMALANISNRRERDIRELFHRVNALEKEVAKLQPAQKRDWRK
tara:strand:- start:2113 stop:2289 length:177 start_codon:yes stop_codon:yes gene_type:complete